MWYIHIVEYYSPIKRTGLLMHTAALVDHKTVVGNEEKREIIANGHRLCVSIHVTFLKQALRKQVSG